LPYQEAIVKDLNTYHNCLLVLARGLSTAKSVALYLRQFTTLKPEAASPHLVFLLNFSDSEIAAIERYMAGSTLPVHKVHSSDVSVSNKRLELYLRGGAFFVSYKILVLDLLTKRLSPSIVTGLVLNQAHKGGKGRTGESFIAEILRKGNQEVAIKSFTERAHALGSVETLMKGL